MYFIDSLHTINPEVTKKDLHRLLDEISLELDYEDLGKKFYERLTTTSGIKLINFKNFEKNSFHVTTELTCKSGDEKFRTDNVTSVTAIDVMRMITSATVFPDFEVLPLLAEKLSLSYFIELYCSGEHGS